MEECIGGGRGHLKAFLFAFMMCVSASPPWKVITHVSDLHCHIAASDSNWISWMLRLELGMLRFALTEIY